jgi:tetratricopeptide (TPR) repeat protein
VYCQRAGERAQELFTPSVAVQHLTQAIEACRRLSLPPSAKLLRLRANAYEMRGQFDNALADHQEALATARTAGDREEEWEILLGLGMLWASEDYEKTGEYCAQALELAQKMDDQSLVAQSLNRVGNWHLNLGRPDEALAYHQRALPIFQALNDAKGTADTLDLLGMTNAHRGDLVQSATYYDQAVTGYRVLDDRRGLVSSLASMSMCGGHQNIATSVPAGHPSQYLPGAEEAIHVAREIGWRAGEAYALWMSACCVAPMGEYGRAFAWTNTALEVAEEIQHKAWIAGAHCTLGVLHLDLLEPHRASEHFELALESGRELRSSHWMGTSSGLLASAFVLGRRLQEAEAILSAALAPNLPKQTIGQRWMWYALGELLIAKGEYADALAIVNQLVACAPNASTEGLIPRLSLLKGQALAALGRLDESIEVFEAARRQADVQGALSDVWRILVGLGNAHAAEGRDAVALASFRSAARIIEQLASTVPDETMRNVFVETTFGLLPRELRPSRPRSELAGRGGLSAREFEVANLVAQGKTNREVAQLLVLSERTVESHVAAALSKLGFSSRMHLAAWALEFRSS